MVRRKTINDEVLAAQRSRRGHRVDADDSQVNANDYVERETKKRFAQKSTGPWNDDWDEQDPCDQTGPCQGITDPRKSEIFALIELLDKKIESINGMFFGLVKRLDHSVLDTHMDKKTAKCENAPRALCHTQLGEELYKLTEKLDFLSDGLIDVGERLDV